MEFLIRLCFPVDHWFFGDIFSERKLSLSIGMPPSLPRSPLKNIADGYVQGRIVATYLLRRLSPSLPRAQSTSPLTRSNPFPIVTIVDFGKASPRISSRNATLLLILFCTRSQKWNKVEGLDYSLSSIEDRLCSLSQKGLTFEIACPKAVPRLL